MGGIAVAAEATLPDTGTPAGERVDTSSLLAAVQLAALGDAESRQMVATNVATDIGERLFKVANVSTVALCFDDGLRQAGRRMADIHANTLRNAVLNAEMRRRTHTEAANGFWFEELHTAGVLRQYDALVFSPASTTMTDQAKRQYGFFTDTESCSVQLLSADGDAVRLQTALVAGKRTKEAGRHDMATIGRLLATQGIELQEADGTALLEHMILVPKQALPNGITDVVSRYDAAAGGTFYGQAAAAQDYQEHAAACERRNQGFNNMVASITDRLLQEAHTFTAPLEAIERLDKLSEEHCVAYAVSHQMVDEAVFGGRAALHIQEARFFAEQGDLRRAEAAMQQAQATAVSGSCPLFKNGRGAGGAGSESGGEQATAGDDKFGSLQFKCPKGHTNTRPRNILIERCKVCKCSVRC